MPFDFVATVSRGLEPPLADELRALGLSEVRAETGIVRFSGPLSDGYRACLWSRVASRVVLSLGVVPAADGDALYGGVLRLPWADHLRPDRTIAVRFLGTSAAIRHPHYGAMRVKDAVCDALRDRFGARPSVDRDDPDVGLHAHLSGDRAEIGVDLSGPPLHLRGRDRDGGPAPLRETLAAACLRFAGWEQLAADGAPLFDPMCGSGTLLTEAADVLADRAPGLSRPRWGFTGWRGHDAAAWRALLDEARDRVRPVPPDRIFGADLDGNQVRRAEGNLARAGLAGLIPVARAPLSAAVPPVDGRVEVPRGLLVTNPPYGVRLGDEAQVEAMWRQLGDVLRQRFLGWEAWILAGDPELGKRLGLRPRRRIVVFNGPIEARLLHVPIASEPPRGRPVA